MRSCITICAILLTFSTIAVASESDVCNGQVVHTIIAGNGAVAGRIVGQDRALATMKSEILQGLQVEGVEARTFGINVLESINDKRKALEPCLIAVQISPKLTSAQKNLLSR